MASWKGAGTLLGLAGAATGLGVGAARGLVRRPLPQTSGVLRAPGLHREVVIDRDAWGIPRIAASSLDDLFFANGFVHAQDRFWQMELSRRIGSGRLSELFGEQSLPADRLMRHLGLRVVAEQEAQLLTGPARPIIEAYCRGVNQYLTTARALPLEFAILRATPPPMPRWRPDPWTIADTMTFGKVLGFGLCPNWRIELIRAAILERLGPERAAALEPVYAADHPLATPGSVLPAAVAAATEAAYAELAPFLAAGGFEGGFSNNWVVDGTRTASGRPLLANDPHLSLSAPSVYYEIELNGPGFNVAGAGFAGVPGVVIGHNRQIAWGLTAAFFDVQDLVVEQLNPEDPRQYRYQDRWRDVQIRREEIAVRGRRRPVVEEVLVTHHGPIISPAIEGESRVLALRSTVLQPGTLLGSVLALDTASSWDEFTDALRLWDAPAHNFVYADVDGNIGYYAPGKVPIRATGNGALPVPGWTGEHEWTGYVPFEALPHAYNPPEHQLLSANNKPVGEDYPYYLGSEWLPGYRARRIADLLGDRVDLKVDDFTRMQQDLRSLPGLAARAVLSAVRGDDRWEREALEAAAAWDGELTAESVGGCVCMAFQFHLLRAVFGPVLGDLTDGYLGTGTRLAPVNGFYSRSLPLLYELVGARDDGWFGRMGATGHTWDGAVTGALRAAVAMLRERLGLEVGTWRWGRINGLSFKHPLGSRPPLDRLFNRGPYERGGDDNTIAAAALQIDNPFNSGGWGSCYRQVVDLGALGSSLSMHAPGQSGHPASEHYDDMIPAWGEFRYHPMSLQVGDVRRELGGRLVLQPEEVKRGPRGASGD